MKFETPLTRKPYFCRSAAVPNGCIFSSCSAAGTWTDIWWFFRPFRSFSRGPGPSETRVRPKWDPSETPVRPEWDPSGAPMGDQFEYFLRFSTFGSVKQWHAPFLMIFDRRTWDFWCPSVLKVLQIMMFPWGSVFQHILYFWWCQVSLWASFGTLWEV